MQRYVARYNGFVQKTERVFSSVEDDYLKVVSGEFEKVEDEDYEFPARNDSSAIVGAKRELKRRFPNERGVRLNKLFRLVEIPLGK